MPETMTVLHLSILLASLLLFVFTHAHAADKSVFSRNKPLRRLQETEVQVLIQAQGQPGLLNEFHFVVLEEAFVEAYNTLAQAQCPQRQLDNVVVERDVSNYVSPGDGSVSRTFTLQGHVTVPVGVSLFATSSPDNIVVRRHLPDKRPSRRFSRSGKGSKGGSMSYEAVAPSDTRTDCSGMTEEAFLAAFQQAILSNTDAVETDVTDVAELTSIPCSTSKNDFFANVIVTFSGDPSLWSLQQQQALEQSFQNTYRSLTSLNPDTCDVLGREILNTTIRRDDTFRRRLQEETFYTARNLQSRQHFSYLYQLSGKCRGCATNSRIFAQGSSGRKLVSDPFEEVAGGEVPSDDFCKCPITATEFRAPTADEFQAAYEEAISILKQENVIDAAFIESIIDVREVRPVDGECADAEPFETQVYVELYGTPETVQQYEIEALEVGFSNTYKQLSASFCDPFFRTPVEVTIDTMTRVRRYLQSRTSFTYQYQVKGLCRGCKGNSRLFGQSVGRLLLASGDNGDGRALFQEDNLCFCSIDLVANRAPNEDEFAVAYNETVKDLNLPSIQYVVSVTEDYESEVGTGGNEPTPTIVVTDQDSSSDEITVGTVPTSTEYSKLPTPAPAVAVTASEPEPTFAPTELDDAPAAPTVWYETAAGATEPTTRPTCIHSS